jgi:hypothetical protein
MADWTSDLSQDYHQAAVRLATVTESRVQHLLFASIELYPHEVPAPPQTIASQSKNVGEATFRVSVFVMSVADALRWYENAASGIITVPGLPNIQATASSFLSEPALGRLLISDEIPFALSWYGGVRVHRLVPGEDLAEPVADLIAAKESEKQTAVRAWLDEFLGFDLLAHDDFLGGLVLLAPNPVARGVATYIKEVLADGSERLGVRAALRQGADVSTLRVRLREERPGGISILESALDEFAMTEFSIPEKSYRIGLELVCSRRGTLSIDRPGHFFRSVHVGIQSTVTHGTIDAPGRRQGEPGRSISLMTVQRDPALQRMSTPPVSGARRLQTLQTQRETRTSYRRPDGYFQRVERDERIFLDDQLDAVNFVQSLVRHARERVVFVDPYFDEKDLRLFALVTQYEGVSVHVLTGRGENLFLNPNPSDKTTLSGDILSADLQTLDADLRSRGRSAPIVLLMGDAARIYHDRFLVVDDTVWHFGHSFNGIGLREVSMACRLVHPEEIRTLILEDVGNATPLLAAWPALKLERKAEHQVFFDAFGG